MTRVSSERATKEDAAALSRCIRLLISRTYTTSANAGDHMRLVTIRGEPPRLGFQVGGEVVAVTTVSTAMKKERIPSTPRDLWPQWDEHMGRLNMLAREAERLLDKGTVEPIPDPDLGPPVPNPPKIIGVGLNYVDHAKESGMAVPEKPVLFAKFPNALCGPNDEVVRPKGVSDLDYEAELAVI